MGPFDLSREYKIECEYEFAILHCILVTAAILFLDSCYLLLNNRNSGM